MSEGNSTQFDPAHPYRGIRGKRISYEAGQTFGTWTLLRPGPQYEVNKAVRWWCRCACGFERLAIPSALKFHGSVGCNACRAARRSLNRSEGTKLALSSYRSMLNRCYNAKMACYCRYGARGIAVCERWRESFENFLEDMGERPSVSHTIDRINGSGNYEPSNCRWATKLKQARNMKSNVNLTLNGETHCISEWAAILGIRQGLIASRHRSGKSVEECLKVGRAYKYGVPVTKKKAS